MNTENPDYVDPSKPDPRFPDRPTHPDFVRLSEIIQEHDHAVDHTGAGPFEVLKIDEKSFLYFLRNRLQVFAVGVGLDPQAADNPVFMALYLDAFALGKRYAEKGEAGE